MSRIIFENDKCLNNEFVIITEYGQFYHDDPSCSNLGISENNVDVNLLDAKLNGFEACPKCYDSAS